MEWTPYGKVSRVRKISGETLDFAYDPLGRRIMKKFTQASGDVETTYYTYDASGNLMAVYERTLNNNMPTLSVSEHPIYGSSRLGVSSGTSINEDQFFFKKFVCLTGLYYICSLVMNNSVHLY